MKGNVVLKWHVLFTDEDDYTFEGKLKKIAYKRYVDRPLTKEEKEIYKKYEDMIIKNQQEISICIWWNEFCTYAL